MKKLILKIKWMFHKTEKGNKYCYFCKFYKTSSFITFKDCKIVRPGGRGTWHYVAHICKECWPNLIHKRKRG